MIRKLCLGLFARLLNPFVKVQPKCWVFGADYGKTYREGSKYLLQYMLQEHPDYDCCFVTQNPEVMRKLRAQGIRCVDNLSVEGIRTIARAEAVFTTQAVDDIRFAYRKPGRHHFYLVHGQPFKVAVKSLTQDYLNEVRPERQRWTKRLMDRLYLYLLQGNDFDDVDFVSATSDFLVPYSHKDFGEETEVKVIGSPRNDALFAASFCQEEPWPADFAGHKIITYMPTHRKYGRGDLSPLPFLGNEEVQQWLREHNYLLLVKQHPNMIPQLKGLKQTDVIRDITTLPLDPQVILCHTDVLITDYSSVWIDFLLLRRPLLFYLYDDFVHEDVGYYYDFKQDFPGHFCQTEAEMFQLLQQVEASPDALRPTSQTVAKYHKYQDGNSCQRYFEAIRKILDNEGQTINDK